MYVLISLFQSGLWDVNITAWNPISSDHVQTTIYVGDTMKGLDVTDGNERVGKNKPYSIDITFEKTAPDMCVLVDFGDSDPDAADQFVYSNSTCPQYPGIPVVGEVFNPMKVTYTYPSNGQYHISVEAGNLLHMEDTTLTTTISNAQCSRPELSIYEHRPNNYDPLQLLRGDDVVLEGFAEFDCEVTVKNSKEWKASKLDVLTGEEIKAVDLTAEAITGTSAATLLIPAQYLDYGLYVFEFTVTMDPAEFPDGDVFASTISTHVQVKASPLRPALEVGRSEMITRGFGQFLKLQPGSLSKDPDVPDWEPQVMQ